MRYVIFGAGTWGKRTLNCLNIHGYKAVAFIDNNTKRHGTDFENLPIISIDEYKQKYADCIIIIAVMSKEAINDIKNNLYRNGIHVYFVMRNCPLDLMRQYSDRIFPFDEVLSKTSSLINNKKIAISDLNFFGVLLYDNLLKKNQNVTLLVDKNFDMNDITAKKLAKEYKLDSEYKQEEYDVILQINPNIETNNKIEKYNKNKIPFFEFPYLSYYQNPELIQFKNIYTNKDRCFIVATGPSLRMSDLDLLYKHNEITFSMNRVYKAFSQTEWRPTYYFAADIDMLLLYEDDLLNINVQNKFLSDWYIPFWEKHKNEKNMHRYHILCDYERKIDEIFSEDITKGMYGVATVVSHIFQAAIYMGLKRIYIIGADFEYYKNDGTDDRSHFIKGYRDKNKIIKPSTLDIEQILKSYEAAKKYADSHGIKIYNATRGGKLEVFERVDFDSLF